MKPREGEKPSKDVEISFEVISKTCRAVVLRCGKTLGIFLGQEIK